RRGIFWLAAKGARQRRGRTAVSGFHEVRGEQPIGAKETPLGFEQQSSGGRCGHGEDAGRVAVPENHSDPNQAGAGSGYRGAAERRQGSAREKLSGSNNARVAGRSGTRRNDVLRDDPGKVDGRLRFDSSVAQGDGG